MFRIKYFGIEKGYRKVPLLNLESLLKPSYTVSTARLFDILTDPWFGKASYFSRKRVNDYLDMVEMKIKLDTSLKNPDKYIWRIKETRYLINNERKDREQYLKNIYEREKRNISFNEFVAGFDKDEEYYFSIFDLDASYLGKKYSEVFIKKQQDDIRKNYEINMNHFNSLDEADFNKALKSFLERNKGFKEIKDLHEVSNAEGYYILVLDKYKQVYIGVSSSIAYRIIEHWSTTKQFDRRIFGKTETSKLPIDAFGMLDTTRIFVKIDINATDPDLNKEDFYIKQFPNKYVTNRTDGGELLFGPVTKLER